MTFTFSVTAADWGRVTPELVMAVMTLVVMLVDLLLPRSGASAKDSGPTNFTILPLLSLLGIAGAFAATIILFLAGDQQAAFNNMIGSDYGSLYAYIIILSASALGILLSPSYLKRLNLVHQGEYYALYLLATLGMLLMSAALNFLVIFLGLEMLSLALYILCGFVSRRIGSQEASMKYFLLSSFASAILLYGIALTYGSTGSTTFINVRTFLSVATHHGINSLQSTEFPTHTLLLVAMGLMVVGFAFKVSAIPFQAWTPDVYDGAPAPVTAFMSVGTKAAAIIAFARVFDIVLGPVISDWQPIVLAIAILTIIGGNILALVQTNTKRLLAYSSIAHAGYLLIGVVVGGTIGISAILFYLLCYTFMNLGAFGVVSVLEHVDNTGSNYSDIRGLWYRQPILAGTLAIFLLALAGFPPMSGFAAKYYIFYAALQGGHPELLIIGVLASVLGMYYYLRVIATMFMEKEPVATAATTTAKPQTGNLTSGKRNSTKLSRDAMVAPAKGGTAVAVKPKTTAAVQPKTVAPTATAQSSNGNWFTWIALGAALIGTFAMGTVLPFWLVQLAQQAAGMMMSLR
ncbi:MAG TPA: NADH-quinone oxidoreductase subunit N [Ktedonobacteraceae bacterium]|nr:NADH-quinone oxidoreductase subunit N [Ktedonobacteraceae bacterium]